MKKLCKGRDKKLCGVCSGFAEYMDWDVSLVRIIWVLAVVFGGASILLYFIAALIMPDGE